MTLTKGGLSDTYVMAGNTEKMSTYHGFKGKNFEYTDGRFDWILVRGFVTNVCTVIKDEQPPIYTSDHYPVLADIQIE